MSADPSDQDLKALWQDQAPETDPMTLEHIQTVSRRLDHQQRRSLFISIGVVVFTAFIAGQEWQRPGDPLLRAALGLEMVGIVVWLFMAYRQTHLTRDPTEPAGAFLRRRLQQILRPKWLLIAPLLPGVAAIFAVSIRNATHNPHLRHLGAAQWAVGLSPIAIIVAAWLYVLLFAVPRVRRRVRERIAELDAMLEK